MSSLILLPSCNNDENKWVDISLPPEFNNMEYFRMERGQIWVFDVFKLSNDLKDTIAQGIETWAVSDTIYTNKDGVSYYICTEKNLDNRIRLSFYSFNSALQTIRFSYNRERIILTAFDANMVDGTPDYHCTNTSSLQTCFARFPVRKISNDDTTYHYNVDIISRNSQEEINVERRLSLVKELGPSTERELHINKNTKDTVIYIKHLVEIKDR